MREITYLILTITCAFGAIRLLTQAAADGSQMTESVIGGALLGEAVMFMKQFTLTNK